MEMDYNLKTFGERFQVLCFYFAKGTGKLIMVCTPCEDSLDIFHLVLQGLSLCERRHSIISKV